MSPWSTLLVLVLTNDDLSISHSLSPISMGEVEEGLELARVLAIG
jgi:hypothetical protein